MAVAILAAVVVLLVLGLVVALWPAARARRRFPLAFKPAPWSSAELDGLRNDLTDVGGPDPIATLARADSRINWDHSEPKPRTYSAQRGQIARTAAIEPVADLRGEVPVVVLVAGAGFLGTGTTAALPAGEEPEATAERRLRLA